MDQPIKIDAKESDYLYTQKSQISNSGLGLFTAITIHRSEIIALFKGEILNSRQSKKRADKGDNAYFLKLPNGDILDTNNSKCLAGFANDAEGTIKSTFKNNAEIIMDDEQNICLMAKKKIDAGEEIFCAYGKKYWEDKKQKTGPLK